MIGRRRDPTTSHFTNHSSPSSHTPFAMQTMGYLHSEVPDSLTSSFFVSQLSIKPTSSLQLPRLLTHDAMTWCVRRGRYHITGASPHLPRLCVVGRWIESAGFEAKTEDMLISPFLARQLSTARHAVQNSSGVSRCRLVFPMEGF